jgi:hypothetical protein
MPQELPIPRRENFAPFLAIAGLGLVKGALVTAGIGIAGGVASAYAMKALYSPGVDAALNNLPDMVDKVKELAQKGVYSGPASKVSFYSAIGFGNGMRICAYTAEQAKEQTLFMLYACAYASGNEQFLAMAEDYEDVGGWFGGEEKFTDYQSAAAEMAKVLGVMRSSSNQLVRDMTFDFALIARAECMAETNRGVGIELTGGENPCGDMDMTEKIWSVLDGLFFFGGRPCMMSKEKWRKTRILVYTPMILVTGTYLMPILKPLVKIGTKGLERLAEDSE